MIARIILVDAGEEKTIVTRREQEKGSLLVFFNVWKL